MTPAWLDELPLRPGPPWHAMGTRAEASATWSRDPEQLAEKARLLDDASTHDEAVVRLVGHEEAEAEAASFVVAGAGRLEDAARAVADDLCVLVRRASGGWVLASAVVCFPSRWRPRDKLGRPVAEIHGPVPAYAEELADRVDRFLDALRPGRGAWRRNWLLHDDPALHQPVATPPPAERPVEVPDGLWLRSERQALHALPCTGAVLFTIRTEQVPLAVVAGRPAVRRGLAAALGAWSPDLVAFRGAAEWRDGAVAWLEGRGP